MNGLTARERRLVAVGLLVAAAAVVWLLVVSPVLSGFAARAQARERLREELTRNVRLLESQPAARLQAANADRDAVVFALAAPSPAQAAEAARSRLTSAVETEGGAVRGLRGLEAPARRVRLQADLRMSWIGLTRLIRRLETDRPFATVDALEVTANGAPALSSAATPLEIRLELTYAYR